MRVIIMADGQGKRWNNYTGVPKHLALVNGETILHRTVRLLKENGVNDIYITSHDKRYNIEGTTRYEPKNNVYEIDRFCACYPIWEKETLFMYGDVYYTENAIKTIVNEERGSFTYFGRFGASKVKGHSELFAIKVKDREKFNEACMYIRKGLEKGTIKRGIGWETYKYLSGKDVNMSMLEFKNWMNEEHPFFVKINDDTDDFDSPEDYDNFIGKKKIVFYLSSPRIGGTYKATLELIKKIYKLYNVIVAFDDLCDVNLLVELSDYADVINVRYKTIKCDLLIYVGYYGRTKNISYKKSIQWNHTSVEEITANITKRDVDYWVTVSNESQKQLKNKFNTDSIVIRNEIADVKELMKEKVKLKKATLNLVTISRIAIEKGFSRMFKFVNELKKNNIDFIWYFVGDARTKEYSEQIKNIFKDFPEVIFVGNKLNPYPYLKNADYGVILSDRESDCLFVRECRKINLPVIVTNWRGVEEQVIDGDNGYILDMELSNLDIDKIMKKELKPKNKIESEYEKWIELIEKC